MWKVAKDEATQNYANLGARPTYLSKRQDARLQLQGMITSQRRQLACSAASVLILFCLLVQPIVATPVKEINQVPSYAYEDPAEVIFYPSALSPETADYGALDVMPASPHLKKVMPKRSSGHGQLALDRIFSRLRSRHTKENSKRGIDFGLGRGFSGSQAAKHFMGIAAAQYSGGPGKRKRSGNIPVYRLHRDAMI